MIGMNGLDHLPDLEWPIMHGDVSGSLRYRGRRHTKIFTACWQSNIDVF
jgi:hypothetical protein